MLGGSDVELLAGIEEGVNGTSKVKTEVVESAFYWVVERTGLVRTF